MLLRRHVLASLLASLLPAAAPAQEGTSLQVSEKGPQTALQRAIDQAACTGEYADAILALTPKARELDRTPEANYSYCLRNTATYECLYYGTDGKTKKRTVSVSAHGTAFAYMERTGDYFLLTNEHVATWPAVTDEDHHVDEVPFGCKKVDEKLALVRDESDDYEPGHIAVSKVASDPAMDAAIVKTHHKLNLLPYRVGRSALLRAGNIVQVRGFPLGILQATNYGTVVTAYDRDKMRDWDHVDFVMDALVTKGNSGSPVLAVSCRTGELELVGLFHAGYKGSPALNVVVGIDQLREFMETFKRTKPAHEGDEPAQVTHEQVVAALARPDVLPWFKVGDRMARARLEPDGTVIWEVFSDAFPNRDTLAVVLKDAPGSLPAGGLSAFALDTGEGKLRWLRTEAANAETQDLARRMLDVLRAQLLRTLDYRDAAPSAKSSREAFKRVNDLVKALDKGRPEAGDLLKGLADAADRLPPPDEAIVGTIQGMAVSDPGPVLQPAPTPLQKPSEGAVLPKTEGAKPATPVNATVPAVEAPKPAPPSTPAAPGATNGEAPAP